MDLYQSPQQRNKKWIPDANLSGLIPISNKTKQDLDVRCQSIWAYSNLQHMIIGKQMPNYTDLQLHPHIQQTNASSKEKMSGQ